MAFFSILIPSYKSEEYIANCVSSIINQSFTDYEILICDQGYTDSSFLKKAFPHSNIHIFKRDNPSAYKARVELIKRAKGEYIIFVDSDDLLREESLLKLHSIIIQTNFADLYIYKSVLENSLNDVFFSGSFTAMPKEDFLKLFLSSSQYNFVTTKCYKNKQSYSFYDFEINKTSDKLTNIALLQNVESIIAIDDYYYIYKINPSSITNSIKAEYIEQTSFVNYISLSLIPHEDNITKINCLSNWAYVVYSLSCDVIKKYGSSILKESLSGEFYNKMKHIYASNKKSANKKNRLRHRFAFFLLFGEHYRLLKIVALLNKKRHS